MDTLSRVSHWSGKNENVHVAYRRCNVYNEGKSFQRVPSMQTNLQPTMQTNKSNKYRHITVMCLLLAVVIGIAIALTFSTHVPEAVSPELAKKLAIAVQRDTPRVTLQGLVYLPDGSLASECHLYVSSVAFFRADRPFDNKMSPHCSLGTHGLSSSIKSDGTFQIDNHAIPGSNTVITVYGWQGRKNERFVSKPMVIVPHEFQEVIPVIITLEEGIPVRGKIMYDNETPAVDRDLEFVQPVEPVLGADIPEMRNALWDSRWSGRANNDGEFVIFLLPGEYTVRDRLREQTLTIAATDTEKQLNWTVPTPIFVEVEKENGLPTGRIDYSFYTPEKNWLFSSSSNDAGAFVLNPITEDALLYMSDAGKRVGSVETITPDMAGKTTRFTLKPMAHATVTLVDANGNPAAGQRVRLSIEFRSRVDQGSCATMLGSAVTDSEGKAVFSVAPGGKIPVRLRLSDAHYEEPIPTGGITIRYDIAKEIALTPGETFDFGTVRLRAPRESTTVLP